MSIAALWGTVVGYTEYTDTVGIETTDGRVAVVSADAFDSLYYRLDEFTAALKENCIEYVIVDLDRDISSYPYWFREAMEDGYITNEYGNFIYSDHNGELVMDTVSVILRSHIGDVAYMTINDFDRFYDTGRDYI